MRWDSGIDGADWWRGGWKISMMRWCEEVWTLAPQSRGRGRIGEWIGSGKEMEERRRRGASQQGYLEGKIILNDIMLRGLSLTSSTNNVRTSGTGF
jgi:hypothetical protein